MQTQQAQCVQNVPCVRHDACIHRRACKWGFLLRADKQKPNNSRLFGVDQTITPNNLISKILRDYNHSEQMCITQQRQSPQ